MSGWFFWVVFDAPDRGLAGLARARQLVRVVWVVFDGALGVWMGVYWVVSAWRDLRRAGWCLGGFSAKK